MKPPKNKNQTLKQTRNAAEDPKPSDFRIKNCIYNKSSAAQQSLDGTQGTLAAPEWNYFHFLWTGFFFNPTPKKSRKNSGNISGIPGEATEHNNIAGLVLKSIFYSGALKHLWKIHPGRCYRRQIFPTFLIFFFSFFPFLSKHIYFLIKSAKV